MHQNTVELLFALLRSIIRGNTLSQQEKLLYSEKILPTLYAISKKYDIAHLVAAGIDKNLLQTGENSPFKNEIMMAVYCYTRLNYEYEIVRILL